ncbi:MAG: FAD-binding oxidoreductase [Burkholderiales bacterium]|nr:FAD-binding oxidoreductase [Burkholderiales bacterium]
MTPSLLDAISAWKAAVGDEYVDLDTETLSRVATATFATSNQSPAVIHPSNREEVQTCVQIANRYRIPIYPVSTGKNWGNGSSAPTANNCVILHLGRLNKITELDQKQACVTIEPGVTQGQLSHFLRESKSGLWVDVTGASAETSLIGNIMERGVGYSPYSNRVSKICRLEVVLPDGRFIVTGFGKYGNAHADRVYPWGLGPSLDGLFTQSNLGIVTRLTLWLMPEPERMECFYFKAHGEDKLVDIIDALQPLKLRGILQSAVHIGNNYKVVNTYYQYPWKLTGGKTPMSESVLKDLARSIGCDDWSGSGSLYGTKNQVKEAKRILRRALTKKVTKLSFMTDSSLAVARRFPGILGKLLGVDLKSVFPIIESIYGMQKGIPSDVTMSTPYWRKKQAPPEIRDPDRDHCGLIWYSPVAPLDGSHATAMYQISKQILLTYAFEPLIAFALMSERALCGVIAIVYDRDVPGEDERAMACHRELVLKLSAAGYYPYRAGIQNMPNLTPEGDRDYVKLISHQLKQVFDPDNILSPGRYEF